MTVFFFIFFANLLGLIPFIGGFNMTGTVGITMVLGRFGVFDHHSTATNTIGVICFGLQACPCS